MNCDDVKVCSHASIINFLLWNVRSINNKTDYVMQYLIDSDIDIACITETWLTDTENHTTFRLKSYGYQIVHKHRLNGKGGGVGFIYKPNLTLRVIKHDKNYESFEYYCVTVSSSTIARKLAVACVYRKQEVKFDVFYSEFSAFCETVVEISPCEFIVLGDFNVHFEMTGSMSFNLESLMSSMGFTQHVQTPSHKSGHMLDLIFTNEIEIPVLNIEVNITVTESNQFKFDHYPISFSLSYNLPVSKKSCKTVSIRNVKSLDFSSFNYHLVNALGEKSNYRITPVIRPGLISDIRPNPVSKTGILIGYKARALFFRYKAYFDRILYKISL